MDKEKLEEGFAKVLEGLGISDSHESARRAAQAWYDELCAGLREAPPSLEVFPVNGEHSNRLVMLNGIPVKSICSHHLLPFTGTATVGFQPGDLLCGLSRLSRAVNHFSRQPQLQEQLTSQIAGFLQSGLQARGVGVLIRATHYCMGIRGVNHPGEFTTTCFTGSLEENTDLREEFMQLSGGEPPAAKSPDNREALSTGPASKGAATGR
ncbi:MAG: GTP cyclohydrolase I [Deltaproteobacteria bacterium]|nr:GTP cyclohydrolase I [Deltaproteobacteria bacterium]